jgi:hypothetical protein
MIDTRKTVVREANHNGNGIKLFPDFIRYYEKYCVNAESIYFITGRKESEFGELTENQLQPLTKLKKFEIIFYPESKRHEIQEYFNWKVKEIKGIIEKPPKKSLVFHIFDDMDDYFPRLMKLKEKWNIQLNLTLIENEKSWNQQTET